QTEIDERIGRSEIVAVWAWARMGQRPFHVILRDYLVELGLNQRNVATDLLRTTAETAARHHGTIDGRADAEMVFESVLECGRLRRPGSCHPDGERRRQQGDLQGVI